MEITATKIIDVLPVLVRESSKDNLLRIGDGIINKPDMLGISIHDYFLCKYGAVVLFEGHIGNNIDRLLALIAGVDSADEVRKLTYTLTDAEYTDIKPAITGKYMEVNDDLSLVWS